jgi:glycosyltransferase involved in cell wall biosynthesis
MESLSVGVLIDVVYPFTHGGAEKRFALLGSEMRRRGHDVTVYAQHWWQGGREHEEQGVRYVAVDEPRQLYANGARRSLVQPALYGLRALQSMRDAEHDLLDCNQFPYVHLPPAQASALLHRKPLVITWHEVWRDYWFGYAPLPAALIGAGIEDLAPRFATHNIAVSLHTADRLRRAGVRAERVSVVPNAIDLERVDRIKPRGEPTDIAFVGRLIAHKRVDRLVAAVARLRRSGTDVRCTIIGSGPEEQRLRSLARGLGVREHVEFTGPVHDEDELLARMKAARVFVSASEREGFGIAALEAMACRLPVVTVDHPMNALAGELVLHGYNGLVIRRPRSRDLAEALAAVLHDEPRRRKLAQKARLTAEAFDKRRVAARLEQVYARAVGEPAPARARGLERSVAHA